MIYFREGVRSQRAGVAGVLSGRSLPSSEATRPGYPIRGGFWAHLGWTRVRAEE
jgi:hypothetical protein